MLSPKGSALRQSQHHYGLNSLTTYTIYITIKPHPSKYQYHGTRSVTREEGGRAIDDDALCGHADNEVWGMWLTPKEVEVIGLMISLVSDAYHIAPTKPVHDDLKV